MNSTPSPNDCSLSDDEDFMDMLLQMCNMDNDIAFSERGYKRLHKICDTKQGDLCKAQLTDNEQKTTDDLQIVAIQRTDKMLYDQRISIEDEEGFTYCVDDDCIEEAIILQYLSADNSSCAQHVVKFVDFFESPTDFFLATEYISSEMNLAQFLAVAKEKIDSGQLSMEHYQNTIRELLRQLFVTMQWLHASKKCCHFDLRPSNILLTNAAFMQTKDGLIIPDDICIKLTNFSVAKLFLNDDFSCDSSDNLQTNAYSAPNVFSGEQFCAQCADNWSLGMIFFECVTAGHPVYELSELMNAVNHDDSALVNRYLERYLQENSLWSQFNRHSFEILHGLLNVNESERLNASNVLKMRWFEVSDAQPRI